MECTTACTVATRAVHRCRVKNVVWLHPVRAINRLLRPANRMEMAMLTRLSVPVRLPTYSQSSKPWERNQTLGWKLRKETEEKMMLRMM